MKFLQTLSFVFLAFSMGVAAIDAAEVSAPAPNTLTAAEKAAGWKLLFDGHTTQGWRAFGKPRSPDKGWVVSDGWLKHEAKAGGGDIVTINEFSDFEFSFEWKVAPGANSGVKYLLSEKRGAVGHEYQVIDDAAHAESSFAYPA